MISHRIYIIASYILCKEAIDIRNFIASCVHCDILQVPSLPYKLLIEVSVYCQCVCVCVCVCVCMRACVCVCVCVSQMPHSEIEWWTVITATSGTTESVSLAVATRLCF